MKNQKRGKNVAIVGTVLQAIISLVMVVIWRLTGSTAALASLWLLLGGIPLWLVTAILFYARQLEKQEALELQEMQVRGGGDVGNIFDESSQLALKPAASRVLFFERWIVPIFTLLFAAYNAAMAILMLLYVRKLEMPALKNTAEGAVFLVLIGFGAFLFSRYCTGMGSMSQWRILRATGSFMLMCALFITAVFVSLILVNQQYDVVEVIVSYVLPAIQVIYAIELLLNFILDIYRPRVPGDEYRPSYESRLFGLLAEPGRVGHSIADTVNYQFGFEVSGTWFYQLISKAFVPLLIFGVIIMFLMSSVVIVQDGEQYVVKHWGKISPERAMLQPGLQFKWPWPIDTAQQFETGVIHEVVLGVGDKVEAEYTKDGEPLILWTKEHGYGMQLERDFLIGVPPREELRAEKEGDSKAPAVSIIKLVVVVQYRVTDPYKYGYKYTDAKELLSCIADEEMVQYCASATLDQALPGVTDRPQAIMTFGREAAAKELQKLIQDELDRVDLGVEIVFVGIVSAHPPSEAVPQFEKVLETERLQDQQRYKAQADANKILSDVAGNPDNALELFLALRKAEVFEGLSKVKADNAVFAKEIKESVRQTQGQVTALDLEIYREKLLGKRESEMSNSVRLRDGYREFLDQLQLAQEQRESFDYESAIKAATSRIDSLFAMLEGTPAKLIAEAQTYRWEKQLREQTALETYQRMLLPFNESPRVYMFDRYMDVLDETLPGMKKYVIGVDRKLLDLRLNLEQQRSIIGEGLEGATGAN